MDKKAFQSLKKEAENLGVSEAAENMAPESNVVAPYKRNSCLNRQGVKNRKKKNKAARKARRRNRKKK